MFYVMLHVMFLMFSVVFLVDEVQRTSGNQSKRVLARDDGATMTTPLGTTDFVRLFNRHRKRAARKNNPT